MFDFVNNFFCFYILAFLLSNKYPFIHPPVCFFIFALKSWRDAGYAKQNKSFMFTGNASKPGSPGFDDCREDFLENFQIIPVIMIGDCYPSLIIIKTNLHTLRCIENDQIAV